MKFHPAVSLATLYGHILAAPVAQINHEARKSTEEPARARRSNPNDPTILSTITDVEGLVQDIESDDDDVLGHAKNMFPLGPLKSRVRARKLDGRTEDGQSANGSGNVGLAALVDLDLGDPEHGIALGDTSSNVGGQVTDTGDDSLPGSVVWRSGST